MHFTKPALAILIGILIVVAIVFGFYILFFCIWFGVNEFNLSKSWLKNTKTGEKYKQDMRFALRIASYLLLPATA